jgi:NAD(P)-dependent dehydrogenase (short-subunit alcohol dehydrogenase family)
MLATAGAEVVICAPKDERKELNETAESLSQESGSIVVPVPCDVTDRAEIDALVDTTVDEFESIEILINNAGIWSPTPVSEVSAETWHRVVDVVLTGTFNCTQLVGPHLRNGGGTVINVASGAGLRGFPLNAPYGAAKAAILNFTETVAFEWAHDDVRVNAVAPGLVATERARRGSSVDVPSAADIDRDHVARRVGRPDEIADVIAFLCSRAASFIDGAVIPVAGVPQLERIHVVRDLEAPWIE